MTEGFGSVQLLVFQPGSMPLTIALFTLVSLGTAYLPTFWAIPTETLDQSAAATAVGFINSVGSIAGFAGPYAFGFLYSIMGSYSSGLSMMMVSGLASGLLLLRVSDSRDSVSIHPAPLRESASESVP